MPAVQAVGEIGRINNVNFNIDIDNGDSELQTRDLVSIVNASGILSSILLSPIRLVVSVISRNWNNSTILEKMVKVALVPPLLLLMILTIPFIGICSLVSNIAGNNEEDASQKTVTAKLFKDCVFSRVNNNKLGLLEAINPNKLREHNLFKMYLKNKHDTKESLYVLETELCVSPKVLIKNDIKCKDINIGMYANRNFSDFIKRIVGEENFNSCLFFTDKDVDKNPLHVVTQILGFEEKISFDNAHGLIPLDAKIIGMEREDKIYCNVKILMPLSTAKRLSEEIDGICNTEKLESILDQEAPVVLPIIDNARGKEISASDISPVVDNETTPVISL